MSMFTGVYPVKHGIMFGMEGKSGDYSALAKRVRLAGYQAAAFTEEGFLIRECGFGEGFARYTENRGRTFQVAPGQVELTFSQARAWLRNQPPRPFFLFVHTYQVHSPYDPPPTADERRRIRVSPPISRRRAVGREAHDRVPLPVGQPSRRRAPLRCVPRGGRHALDVGPQTRVPRGLTFARPTRQLGRCVATFPPCTQSTHRTAVDPGERSPLPLARQEQERLDQAITAYLDQSPDHRALSLSPAGLDAEIVEKLRQLGYVQ